MEICLENPMSMAFVPRPKACNVIARRGGGREQRRLVGGRAGAARNERSPGFAPHAEQAPKGCNNGCPVPHFHAAWSTRAGHGVLSRKSNVMACVRGPKAWNVKARGAARNERSPGFAPRPEQAPKGCNNGCPVFHFHAARNPFSGAWNSILLSSPASTTVCSIWRTYSGSVA